MPSNPSNVFYVFADQWRAQDAGYAGVSAEPLQEEGLADNTLLVFTSDHGDMLGSQGEVKRQRPWEESVRVPL